jgi:hypothetical protein
VKFIYALLIFFSFTLTLKAEISSDCESCDVGKLDNLTISPAAEEIAGALSPNSALYNELNSDFESSELCDPVNNFPEQSAREQALMGLDKFISLFDASYNNQWNPDLWKERYLQVMGMLKPNPPDRMAMDSLFLKQVDPEFFGKDIMNFQAQQTQREIFRLNAQKLQAMMKKVAWQRTASSPELIRSLTRDLYVDNRLLELDERGEAYCPFVDAEVFDKAMQGWGKLRGQLSKPILTIIDYTKPSNQRRMFVIDMKNKKVLHNTWSAHGIGADFDDGADEWGANPKMSNENGSQLSSDGFILARQNSTGNLYGDNVILQGIDVANSRMQSRQVVMHGDSRTGGSYIPFELKPDSESREDTNGRIKMLETMDPMTADPVSVRVMLNAPKLNRQRTLGISNGCIGVPDTQAFDRSSGRHVSQLDSLRRDMSGNSLIFSYSGPEMKSKYFD